MNAWFLAKNPPPFPIAKLSRYILVNLSVSARTIAIATLAKVKQHEVLELVLPIGTVYIDDGTSLEELILLLQTQLHSPTKE